jgi:uncharacterized SAM-binding protein YcdF (DUF218 family)
MKAAAFRAHYRRRSHVLGRLFALAVAAFALTVIGIAVRVQRAATVDDPRPAGAIVVFGAAEYAGRPSPVFRARLDHAYNLFRRGVAPLIITTGSGAKDPKYTEGGVGRDYLISRGIPDLNLIAETRSNDTAQSARRTATILRANRIPDCVAVSDAYHMYRVTEMLTAQGILVRPSPRPASIPRTFVGRWSAALREALSYLLWKIHVT